MALKDKFASSIAARSGITQPQAALALAAAVDLLKTKFPPMLGQAMDNLMSSDNGIDPAHFMVPIAAQAVARLPDGPFKQMAIAATVEPGRFVALGRAILGLFKKAK
jgi:hypothetical protein